MKPGSVSSGCSRVKPMAVSIYVAEVRERVRAARWWEWAARSWLVQGIIRELGLHLYHP